MTDYLAIPIAYLIGSIPFAVVISKLFGLSDPRTYGSGNPGATNVLRSGNKLAAALTFLGDASKGAIAVLLTFHFLPNVSSTVIALVALAAFLGHLFSPFLGFKGGKGVATSLGIFLALDFYFAIALLSVWVLVVVLFKISALAAIITALSAPFLYIFLNINNYIQWPIFVAVLIMATLLLYKHKSNIDKLFSKKH
ncbi:glycerol-3-phosphate 1-O-acyltransferase PlsY [Taylorella equigenitalis]|uniref:glycerol-3-phosphate 1-O-acyltransferase PlsY n=1 Tax=Taylorella equigenitalis TaxID=29575 RepID=UPI0004027882|nr:glycerol-3-phosphate 1-O-acyltransferase PlsY [Taylorella equigenitalis]ASY37956.1 acyl-phosphate glycerol 3-phosphate acyltransferase [Taylorella equigenitalis]KGK32975.1 acyl-phosphate glycerol 3-phosphate acyltransferase [Taylorella equigenitalis]RBA25981.1 glycerol-3-phosphate 1-O-acyltransferase [Taylorella equigenitalis]WDU45800.1 glycerol-3-phosphate 1-O-acyltransferase PlsY [Taylorella equigenitalis]WDU47327.1 glycerol-3-phosphate 1-O-acyltransferase PlsY [Taylorella equigenitalis]